MPQICPYCQKPARLTDGLTVFPHLRDPAIVERNYWVCEACDARVSCISATQRPTGTMANKALRKARQDAHRSLDWLWKSGRMKRSETYEWLARRLSLSIKDCHISLFDEAGCALVIKAVEDYLDVEKRASEYEM